MPSYDISYTYDAVGNRTKMTDHLSGDVTTHVYDAANQLLTSENGSGITTYTYDAAGNRTRKESATELTEYTWDQHNRMILAEPITGPITMTYNGDGQRVKKETPTETTQYIYDGKHLLQEKDGSGATTKLYTHSENEYGDLISEFDETTDETADHAYNAQWTTEALLDENETTTATYKHTAFGLQNQHTGAEETRFTFIGKQGYYHDQGLNLYLLGGSGNSEQSPGVYDPATGQFVRQDPVENEVANAYRYVGNNPVNVIDPSGLEELELHPAVKAALEGLQRQQWDPLESTCRHASLSIL